MSQHVAIGKAGADHIRRHVEQGEVEGVEDDDGVEGDVEGVVEDCAQATTGALKTTSNDTRK